MMHGRIKSARQLSTSAVWRRHQPYSNTSHLTFDSADVSGQSSSAPSNVAIYDHYPLHCWTNVTNILTRGRESNSVKLKEDNTNASDGDYWYFWVDVSDIAISGFLKTN